MSTYNDILFNACRNGNKALAESIIKKILLLGGEDFLDWNQGLIGACLEGHIELAELMIEKGASCWKYGLRYA